MFNYSISSFRFNSFNPEISICILLCAHTRFMECFIVNKSTVKSVKPLIVAFLQLTFCFCSPAELFEKPEVSDIKFLFLVGGFAESPLLQQAVQNMLQGRSRIIIPHDVGLTILKGAVLFGLDPSVIKVRRSPLTYGVGVLNRFVEGKHPAEKLLVKDGTRWCTDVFDTFIAADQSVALGEMVKRSYTPAKPSQQVIVIHVYCSEKENVGFISESGVRKCGTLRLDVSGTESTAPRREIQTLMQFGDTEIRAMAVDVSTGRTVKASIDFLSH